MAFTVYVPKESLDAYTRNADKVAWAIADASNGVNIEFQPLEGLEEDRYGNTDRTF